MQVRRAVNVLKASLAAFITFLTCGSDGCHHDTKTRTITEARVESARILRGPTICDGESGYKDDATTGGFTCVDNHGGLVTCPPDASKPCQQNAGNPEAAPLPDAGLLKD